MKTAAATICLVLLAGCLNIPARKTAVTWNDVAAGEVVVVGKIELSLPLQDVEQALLRGRYKKYRQMAVMVTSRDYRPFREPNRSNFNGRIEARLEQPFFAVLPAEPIYYMGSFVFLDDQDISHIEKAILPGGLKVDIKPTDRAIYIGTIRYYRDEFFEILDCRVIDEYSEANEQFKARFGSKVPLKKTLLRVPGTPHLN